MEPGRNAAYKAHGILPGNKIVLSYKEYVSDAMGHKNKPNILQFYLTKVKCIIKLWPAFSGYKYNYVNKQCTPDRLDQNEDQQLVI